MSDKLDPIQILFAILIKGVLLGVILFIALPVKNMLDKGARAVGNTAKDAFRKERTVKVKQSLLKVPKRKGSAKTAQKVMEQVATSDVPY